MHRRSLLKSLAAIPLLPDVGRRLPIRIANLPLNTAFRRVRPTDPTWPDAASWERLNQEVGGRLIKVQSPLAACIPDPQGAACAALFRELKNPYFIGDQVNLTQTTGWVDAWTSQPSVYAVAAQSADDVAAAVNFARNNNLRLVVKGGGHSYLGTSNAPDSLLVWTRRMNTIDLHDDFVAEGCAGREPPQPAVTLGAGAIWGHAYDKVTSKGGRYVQGGGCLTVGVAGLVQAGGFGSFSKNFGIAAASLLEAEIVTADGRVRIVNRCTDPDLFWALKGGGGSLGVVTRLTLKTHDLPEVLGVVAATIEASSDTAFRRLVGRFVDFYADNLSTPHWGEIITIRPRHRLDIRMNFQGLDRRRVEALWQPFFDWVVATMPQDFAYRLAPVIRSIPARHAWDPAFLKAYAPGAVLTDDRPGASADNIFWSANLGEAGHFLYGFQSLWLPRSLLQPDRRERLADALCAAGRHWSVELHTQKGLAGGSEPARAATGETAMNPAVLDAFALAIVAGEGPPAFAGLAGREPDLAAARRHAGDIAKAMAELRKIAPDGGSYGAESDFFERQWQTSYWGPHYPRLLSVKQKYDPTGLFFVHHGVGSEDWSGDGFTRVAGAGKG